MSINLDETLKQISPGSVFITQGEHWISQVVGWFYILTHLKWAIKNKFKIKCCHAGIYLGGGNHTVVETMPKKVFGFLKIPWGVVGKHPLEKAALDNKNIVWVYANTKMTVHQLQLLKVACYSSIGRLYDIFAVLNFLVPSIDEEPAFLMCSEFVTEAVRQTGLPIVPDITEASKVHPTDLYRYLESNHGKNSGWKEVFKWNKGSFETY